LGAGNLSAVQTIGPIWIDTVLPTVTLTSHTNAGSYYNNTGVITISGTSQDCPSNVNYTIWNINRNNETGSYNSATTPCTAWNGATEGDPNWSGTWQNLSGENWIYIADYDKAGNFSGWTHHVKLFTDVAAPNNPSFSVVDAVSSSQINLNWSLPADNGSGSSYPYTVGDVGVSVKRDGTIIYATGHSENNYFWNGLSVSDTGLSENTQHAYTIAAQDNTQEIRGDWHNTTSYVGSSSKYTLCNLPSGFEAVSDIEDEKPYIDLTVDTFPNHGIGSSGYKFDNVDDAYLNIFWTSGWQSADNTWRDNNSGNGLIPDYKYYYQF